MVAPPFDVSVRTACQDLVAHVDAYESEAAEAAFARLCALLVEQPALASGTLRALAAGWAVDHDDWATRALVTALELVGPHAADAWVDVAIDLVAQLARDHLDAPQALETLIARLEDAARGAHGVAVRVAEALHAHHKAELAFAVLRRALDRATDERAVLELAGPLDAVSYAADAAVRAATSARIADVLAASRGPVTSLHARAHLMVARSCSDDAAALAHARVAQRSDEAAIRDGARYVEASCAFRAGELARAEALASAVPGVDASLLVDLVRRRLGTWSEPPPEAFFDPPGFVPPALPDDFTTYFKPDPASLELVRAQLLLRPLKVREWSHGHVRCAADLGSERIFGPVRSYRCGCDRYVGARYAGLVCHRCGVELTSSAVRGARPGHLALDVPAIHPWYVDTLAAILGRSTRSIRRADLRELREALPADDGDPSIALGWRWRWVILDLVPVWPPEATLPTGVDRDELRRCYVDVIEAGNPARAVERMFALFAR